MFVANVGSQPKYHAAEEENRRCDRDPPCLLARVHPRAGGGRAAGVGREDICSRGEWSSPWGELIRRAAGDSQGRLDPIASPRHGSSELSRGFYRFLSFYGQYAHPWSLPVHTRLTCESFTGETRTPRRQLPGAFA